MKRGRLTINRAEPGHAEVLPRPYHPRTSRRDTSCRARLERGQGPRRAIHDRHCVERRSSAARKLAPPQRPRWPKFARLAVDAKETRTREVGKHTRRRTATARTRGTATTSSRRSHTLLVTSARWAFRSWPHLWGTGEGLHRLREMSNVQALRAVRHGCSARCGRRTASSRSC